MAERLAFLEAVVGIDITQFRKGMRDIRNETGILSETIGGIGHVARNMTLAVTAPLVAMGSMMVETASTFEASMRNINSISQLTEEQFASLSAQTLEFGKTTRSGAIEASGALYTVFSAGITDTADAFATMQVATRTAEAGLANVTTTTEALVAVMLSYGDTSGEMASRVSDALTAMVQVGVGSMEQFAGSIGNVVPTATALGVEVEELFSNMSYLTQRGLNPAKASVSLNAVLNELLAPTDAMKMAFQELGVASGDELIEKFGGLTGALQEVIGTADGSSETLGQLFNNVRAFRGVALFANDVEGWAKAIADFEGSLDGATDRAWQQQMMSFSATWDLFQSSVQGVAITIGNALMPVLQPLIAQATVLMNGISDLNPEIIQTGVAIAGVVAVLPPLVWLMMSLLTPVGLVTSALIGLASAFVGNFGGIRDIVSDTIASIIGDITPLTDFMGEVWEAFSPPDFVLMTDPEPIDVNMENLITITEPTSLWAIYEETYDEMYGWGEFMAMATANGWEGGALEAGDTLRIAGEEIVNGVASVNEDLQRAYRNMGEDGEYMIPTPSARDYRQNGEDAMHEAVEPYYDFWDMVGTALRTNVDTLLPYFQEAWNRVVSWVDTTFSGGIDWVANLFSGGTATDIMDNIYVAIGQVSEGDILGALNTLVPDLGTWFGGMFSNIDTASILPKITTSLTNLFSEVVTWVRDTGIPSLASIAGLLVNEIGQGLKMGFDLVWGFFTGGEAGDKANEVTTYVQDNVIDPFMAELDGLPSEVTTAMGLVAGAFVAVPLLPHIVPLLTPLKALGGALLGLLNPFTATAVAIGLFGTAITVNRDGIVDFLNDNGFSWLAPYIERIADAFEMVGNTITNVFNGSTLTTASDEFGEFMRIFSAGSEPAVSGITSLFEGIGTAITNLTTADWSFLAPFGALFGWLIGAGVALVGNTLGITLTVVSGAIKLIADTLSMTTGVIVEGLTALGQFLMGDYSGASATWEALMETFGTPVVVPPPDISWTDIETNFSPEMLGQGVAEVEAIIQEAFLDEMIPVSPDVQLAEGALSVDLSSMNVTELQELRDGLNSYLLTTDMSASGEAIGRNLIDNIDVAITNAPPLETTIPVDTTFETPEGLNPAEQLRAQIEADIASNTPAMTESFNSLMSAMTSSTDADGNISAQPIIDNFLTPLNTAWIGAFGLEGTMTVAYNGFSTGFIANNTLMQASVDGFSAGLAVAIPAIEAQVSGMAGVLRNQMAIARREVEALSQSIKALLTIDGTLNVNVVVTGNTEVDGAHETGLARVPYDGYVAELHKGERVLTAEEANSYGNVARGALDTRSYNEGNTGAPATVNVYGVSNVDDLLREMKRRGIQVG